MTASNAVSTHPVPIASYAGRPELMGPTWSWTAETAAHALRIVLGGVFDRFPGARLILGQMGETIPLDSRTRARAKVASRDARALLGL